MNALLKPGSKLHGRGLPYIYLAPGVLIIFVISFLPAVYMIGISFTNLGTYHWFGNVDFVGLRNYFRIFSRLKSEALVVIGRTILWTVVNLLLQIIVGVGLALFLNSSFLHFKALYRTLYIAHWAVPFYISALIWKYLFNFDFGPINQILNLIGLSSINWLGNSVLAFIALNIVNLWMAFPFMMVMALGGLQSIPEELYDASKVDGANSRQQFRFITLPLLRPAITPAVVLSAIATSKVMEMVWLVTKGGPSGATDLVMTWAYKEAFETGNYGFSAAFAMIIFLMLFVATKVSFAYINRAEKSFK